MVAVYCILAVVGSDRLLSVKMNVVVMRKRRHQVFVARKRAKVLQWTVDVLGDGVGGQQQEGSLIYGGLPTRPYLLIIVLSKDLHAGRLCCICVRLEA